VQVAEFDAGIGAPAPTRIEQAADANARRATMRPAAAISLV
jgi:hypothetical protein